ncbi:hypothetical protein G6F62_014587 [Rhizopus arrhizus]|nr:hypothetical protein G6F62_014587 [Rhizopus arrhizus]
MFHVRDDVDHVRDFGSLRVERLAVHVADDGAQQGVGRQHEGRGRHRLQHQRRARAGADGGRAPQGGCGVQAADTAAFAHDRAGAQESHARHHVGDHARAAVRAAHAERHVDEDGGPHRHQHVRAQAGRALPELASS